MLGSLLDPPGLEICPPETETQEGAVLPLLQQFLQGLQRLPAIDLA